MRSDYSIIRGIRNQMKKPINELIEQKHYMASIILLFTVIDAISNLGRPNNDKFNDGGVEFRRWVLRYLQIGSPHFAITPEHWWSARNGYVHTWSSYSKGTEKNDFPYIVFGSGGTGGDVGFSNDRKMIVVRLESFRDTIFRGIDQFLIDEFDSADEERRIILENRIRCICIPMQKEEIVRKANEYSGEDCN